MPKKISITVLEPLKELQALLLKAQSNRERGRLRALILLKQGKAVYQSQLATKLDFIEKTVREWLKTYNVHGLSALLAIRVGGNNTRVISHKAIDFIATQLTNPQTTITSYIELQGLIEANLGETIEYGTLYAHCRRRHKPKLKVSRKSHYKKDPKAEAVFKKLKKSFELFRPKPNNNNYTSLNLYFQDASRFGLITKHKKVITAIGIKPIGTYKHSYQKLIENFKL